MKRLTCYIILLLLPFFGAAQNSPVDRLFEKYSGKEGYTSVYISNYMFSLFSSLNSQDEETKNVLGGLSGIKILATEKPNKGVNFHNEIMGDKFRKDYKELMVIREKDQHVTFLIKEKDGKIIELLLIVGGEDNVLISIQGSNIDLKTISSLSRSMNIDALEVLDKME